MKDNLLKMGVEHNPRNVVHIKCTSETEHENYFGINFLRVMKSQMIYWALNCDILAKFAMFIGYIKLLCLVLPTFILYKHLYFPIEEI
jgi:hypothetical protein